MDTTVKDIVIAQTAGRIDSLRIKLYENDYR